MLRSACSLVSAAGRKSDRSRDAESGLETALIRLILRSKNADEAGVRNARGVGLHEGDPCRKRLFWKEAQTTRVSAI